MARGGSEFRRNGSSPVGGHSNGLIAVTIALIAAGLVLYPLRWVILPFIVSGVAAYVCASPIESMAHHTNLPRSLFAVIAFAVLMTTASLLGLWAAPALVQEVGGIISDFSGTIITLTQTALGDRPFDLFGYSIDPRALTDFIAKDVNQWTAQLDFVSIVLGSIGGLFGLFLTVVLLFYFLLGGPVLAKGAFWLVPPPYRLLVARIWSRLDPVLKRYFVGVLVVVTYATVAAYIGLGLILGLKHAVLLAFLTGVLEMIPVVGPGSAAIIAGLVAVHYSKGWWPIAGFAIYATVLRLSIDQLVGPLVLGRAARLHPVMVIFCFLSGGVLFGIAGVMLSVPVALAVRSVLMTVYDEDRPETQQPGHESSKRVG